MASNNHTFPYDDALDSKGVVALMPGVALGKNKDVFSATISSTDVFFVRGKRTFNGTGDNLVKKEGRV